MPQEKRGAMNTAGHQLLLTCLETLQRALKGESGNLEDKNMKGSREVIYLSMEFYNRGI